MLVASLSDRALLDNMSAVTLCSSLREKKKQTKTDEQKEKKKKGELRSFSFPRFFSDTLLANRIYANGTFPFVLASFETEHSFSFV